MTRPSVVITLMVSIWTSLAAAQEVRVGHFRADRRTKLHMGIFSPISGPIHADVIYLHGISDRMMNHGPLFKMLTDNQMRVIAFDFPSHGKTRAPSIGWYSFPDFENLIVAVEKYTRADRPLIVMGWSTGGLIATRMAQTGALRRLGRYPTAMVLFAPSVSVYSVPGEWGTVTEKSLTNHPQPPHLAKIKPASAFETPVFSLRTKFNSLYARYSEMPGNLPVLTIIGGDATDLYADSSNLRSWVVGQRKYNRGMFGIQCATAKHQLDNEIEPIGETVRQAAVDFSLSLLTGDNSLGHFRLPAESNCAVF